MGIVNTTEEEQKAVETVLLITPHGDRKQTPAETITAAIASSLPLMGIVNDTASSADGEDASSLITPHGDRKPWDGTGDPLVAELITPHGDRKR